MTFTKGIAKPPNIDDELEALWLTYYQHIFNPARVKIKAMQSEMPKKYWHNLPEAALIKDLTRDAQAQMESMIDVADYSVSKKNQQSIFIQNKQKYLQEARSLASKAPNKTE